MSGLARPAQSLHLPVYESTSEPWPKVTGRGEEMADRDRKDAKRDVKDVTSPDRRNFMKGSVAVGAGIVGAGAL